MPVTESERFEITLWSSGADPLTRAQIQTGHERIEERGAIYLQGTFAARPAAAVEGRLYVITAGAGLGSVFYDTGVAWLHVGEVDGYTTAQRDALADEDLWAGRVIWNTTTGQINYYTGAAWKALEDLSDLATTKGQLLVATAAGVWVAKNPASDGQVLVTEAAQGDGLRYGLPTVVRRLFIPGALSVGSESAPLMFSRTAGEIANIQSRSFGSGNSFGSYDIERSLKTSSGAWVDVGGGAYDINANNNGALDGGTTFAQGDAMRIKVTAASNSPADLVVDFTFVMPI